MCTKKEAKTLTFDNTTIDIIMFVFVRKTRINTTLNANERQHVHATYMHNRPDWVSSVFYFAAFHDYIFDGVSL